MQRIGVFGASFNPPTLGHKNVIDQALPFFDEILLVPSLAHAFHKSLIAIEHRLAMLAMLVGYWPLAEQQKLKIFNIEATLHSKKTDQLPIYTFDVLTAITDFYQKNQVPCQISFILGPDIALDAVWQKFYRYRDIENTWPLFIAKELLAIHSTDVKSCITQYANAPHLLQNALVPFVGGKIAQYIVENKLYQQE
jgi:nicotinate-nucleotide adenylyltransferase